MKQHLGSKVRAGAHAKYVSAAPEEDKVDAPTTITHQLTQQLADIQKQLASLAVQSNPIETSPLQRTPPTSAD